MLVPIAEWESVPEATVHTLRELGAFRLQVRLSFKVFPICKTVNTHLFRFPMSWTVHCGPYQHPIRQIVGGNDLVVGIFIGVFHRLKVQVHLRSRPYDCALEAQDHKETRKAPEGKVLDYRNKFLYTSESGLSATPSPWLRL